MNFGGDDFVRHPDQVEEVLGTELTINYYIFIYYIYIIYKYNVFAWRKPDTFLS